MGEHDQYTIIGAQGALRTTDDPESAFVAAVAAARKHGPVFVVLGSENTDEFEQRIQEHAPTVRDARLEKDACIIAGDDPEEWNRLTR